MCAYCADRLIHEPLSTAMTALAVERGVRMQKEEEEKKQNAAELNAGASGLLLAGLANIRCSKGHVMIRYLSKPLNYNTMNSYPCDFCGRRGADSVILL